MGPWLFALKQATTWRHLSSKLRLHLAHLMVSGDPFVAWHAGTKETFGRPQLIYTGCCVFSHRKSIASTPEKKKNMGGVLFYYISNPRSFLMFFFEIPRPVMDEVAVGHWEASVKGRWPDFPEVAQELQRAGSGEVFFCVCFSDVFWFLQRGK